jgi:hypothetical protein
LVESAQGWRCLDEDDCLDYQAGFPLPPPSLFFRSVDAPESGLVRAWQWISSLIFLLVFLGCWVAAVVKWGFLLGAAFGWVPALIIAVFAAFLWPLVPVALVLVVLAVFALTAALSWFSENGH